MQYLYRTKDTFVVKTDLYTRAGYTCVCSDVDVDAECELLRENGLKAEVYYVMQSDKNKTVRLTYTYNTKPGERCSGKFNETRTAAWLVIGKPVSEGYKQITPFNQQAVNKEMLASVLAWLKDHDCRVYRQHDEGGYADVTLKDLEKLL